jgi:hypothetical protein
MAIPMRSWLEYAGMAPLNQRSSLCSEPLIWQRRSEYEEKERGCLNLIPINPNGEKNITVEQYIQFLQAIGSDYSRHLYMLIVNKIRENPSEYQIHLQKIIQALPEALIAYILKNPEDPMYAEVFNVVFENAASVERFISPRNIHEWREIVKFPAVQERFKAFFQENSSIDQFGFFYISNFWGMWTINYQLHLKLAT